MAVKQYCKKTQSMQQSALLAEAPRKQTGKTGLCSYAERLFLLLMLILPQTAFAAGGDEVTTIVWNLCNYLSGTVARAIGVLAIIFMGYRTLTGRMDWRLAGTIAIGMGLIIGGAYYGTVLLGS